MRDAFSTEVLEEMGDGRGRIRRVSDGQYVREVQPVSYSVSPEGIGKTETKKKKIRYCDTEATEAWGSNWFC
jgi:hypothetical protein